MRVVNANVSGDKFLEFFFNFDMDDMQRLSFNNVNNIGSQLFKEGVTNLTYGDLSDLDEDLSEKILKDWKSANAHHSSKNNN